MLANEKSPGPLLPPFFRAAPELAPSFLEGACEAFARDFIDAWIVADEAMRFLIIFEDTKAAEEIKTTSAAGTPFPVHAGLIHTG
jgi:hypothetical protein